MLLPLTPSFESLVIRLASPASVILTVIVLLRRGGALTALAVGLGWSAVAGAADPGLGVRVEFERAMDVNSSGNSSAAGDSAALRAYVLYPYLEAERLRMRLATASPRPDAEIAALLKRDGDAPWTRDLRSDWLQALANAGQWSTFLEWFLPARADDDLDCDHLSALIAVQPDDPAVLAQVREVYLRGRLMPRSCIAPFGWLSSRDALTEDMIVRRAQTAVQAGNTDLVRIQAQQMSEPMKGHWLEAYQLMNDPAGTIADLAAHGRGALFAADADALAAGFSKLAVRQPDVAGRVLGQVTRACGLPCGLTGPARLSQMTAMVALGYSWSRLPESVAWFRNVGDSFDDPRVYEWRVRAALWAQQWKQALDWLQQMPPNLAADDRWQYWTARCMAELGQTEGARRIYNQLSQDSGYYAIMAAEQLDRGYVPTPKPMQADAALAGRIQSDPAWQRITELRAVDERNRAATEWYDWIARQDDATEREAARLMFDQGWYLLAVDAASRAREYDDYDLLYPRPYDALVAQASKQSGVPQRWIYGVMRQESLFDPEAKSGANARGLLQLLYPTARIAAKTSGLPAPATPDDLYRPEINVPLGAAYLAQQLDTFGGHWLMVLAAYNAGPRAVQRWLPSDGVMAPDVWVENIPYNETRTYIQRILWHVTVMGWRASGKPQRITDALKPITP